MVVMAAVVLGPAVSGAASTAAPKGLKAAQKAILRATVLMRSSFLNSAFIIAINFQAGLVQNVSSRHSNYTRAILNYSRLKIDCYDARRIQERGSHENRCPQN